MFARLRPWLPILLYALTSLAVFIALTVHRDQLFEGLDELSHWLRLDEHYGHLVLFSLIFITTIPPIPMYSTLIVLSGYTFGPLMGALVSYFAALSGALTVFIISRALFRERISRWLTTAPTIRRVVRAIEKRPKLLFLIRLAPYPYNVMNCLLAASPTLTLQTYTICTALSLFKVIIHTSLGASIHSFKDYHHLASPDPDRANAPPPEQGADGETGANKVARLWAVAGVCLCLLILVYLSVVAARAIDDELGEDDDGASGEERVAFLLRSDVESHHDHEPEHARRSASPMVESPFRTHLHHHYHQLVPFRLESAQEGGSG
jgi:uncharacterized membrane protein YdjX (TVP38/TMEM64 family)